MQTLDKEQHQGDWSDLPTSAEKLYAFFDQIPIEYRIFEHEPIFTVAEGLHLKENFPGEDCRCLFLRDKKKRRFLLALSNDTAVALNALPDLLGCGRLSFGSKDSLWRLLGVRPGSVCPFAVINDDGHDVMLILDQRLKSADFVNFHPLRNDRTVQLTPQALEQFVKSCDRDVIWMDFSNAKSDIK